MKKLFSGNEAFAWGAYHAGVKVATAYPGTPSTEILETIAQFKDIYAEWSTNEKVAMEVGLGAAYAGARTLVSMKQVGLNVAMDPFMAAATTGINGGMIVISADDPGTHSSQGEQDNRHYGMLAKVPILEPSDSQEAYNIMALAFDVSEKFDTPVIVRTTTRISHSKSVVELKDQRVVPDRPVAFKYDVTKYVMLPVHARIRHALIEERLVKLAEFAETFPLNRMEKGDSSLGIITSGIAYQYAKEVFPDASFLRLGMTYPLPEKLIKDFAGQVDRILVIEELDPFLQQNIQAMGVKVIGKEFIPRLGELDADTIAVAGRKAGLLPIVDSQPRVDLSALPKRPPLLCPGCPHTGVFHVLSSLSQRLKLPGTKDKVREPKLIIAGDIGCYTLGAYPPLNAMDTTACMGASIGQALGMEKAGIGRDKIVAVIGDSTFLHSGITPLVNAVYNQGRITVIILDNSTTAMTGHQDHPGTGISAQGNETNPVNIEELVRGIGVRRVNVVDAFKVRELRAAIKDSLEVPELSVVIVRGDCVTKVRKRGIPNMVDAEKCNQCGTCLSLGCSAIQSGDGHTIIDPDLCAGEQCSLCAQLCPKHAISPRSTKNEMVTKP
jgi:indolepyruvate ferredoxin oxidoreductase, alpha subunit